MIRALMFSLVLFQNAAADQVAAPAPVAAPVRWASAGSLRVALPPSLGVTIRPVSTKLEKTCRAFEASLATLPQDRERAKKIFDSRRRSTDSASAPVFSAEFRTEVLGTPGQLRFDPEAASNELQRVRAVATSPEIVFAVESLELAQTSWGRLEIEPAVISTSALGRDLGLEPLAIEARLSQGQAAIKVLGKDSVCDLLAGRAKLVARAKLYAHLPAREVRELRATALELRDGLRPLLLSELGPSAKALRAGLRWASLFASAQRRLPIAQDEEAQSLAFLERLVDPETMRWRPGAESSFSESIPDSFEIKDGFVELMVTDGGGQ